MKRTNAQILSMPKQRCKCCDELVAMRYLPQSDREYCPECDTVQSDRPENDAQHQSQTG